MLRAAVEAEANLDQPRFEAFDHQPSSLIATESAWADYARQLGAAADACALPDTLLPPSRVLEALEGVPLPFSSAAAQAGGAQPPAPLTPTRLLRLAASASRKAAVSSRQEIYPRGMAPLQALKQSLGALVGAPQLSAADIQGRVRGRYPEASPLPNRPELDRLLEESGAPLAWNASAADGRGAYCLDILGRSQTAGTTTQFSRHATLLTTHVATDSDVALAAAVEERLGRGLEQGGMVVLTVHPRIARRAESELLHRFGAPDASPAPLQRINFDALLLSALRDQAKAAGVDWNVVLEADAADQGSRHWVNLQRLVQRTLPTIRQALLFSAAPVLLVSAGLLARYNLMAMVTELEENAGRPGQTPSVWLLLPTSHQGLPVIDGVAVPMINPSASLVLVQSWVENLHRASTSLKR